MRRWELIKKKQQQELDETQKSFFWRFFCLVCLSRFGFCEGKGCVVLKAGRTREKAGRRRLTRRETRKEKCCRGENIISKKIIGSKRLKRAREDNVK